MMKTSKPTLYIFAGLPGSGKSTLAKRLAEKTGAAYFRIDTIEQGLKDVCKMDKVEGEGYRLTYLVVKDNLRAGNNVISDSVNPWELSRDEWNEVATSVNCNFVDIEVCCSNETEHKNRLEIRDTGIKNLKKTTWEDVINRDYHPWTRPRIQIDTASKSIDNSFVELLNKLNL